MKIAQKLEKLVGTTNVGMTKIYLKHWFYNMSKGAKIVLISFIMIDFATMWDYIYVPGMNWFLAGIIAVGLLLGLNFTALYAGEYFGRMISDSYKNDSGELKRSKWLFAINMIILGTILSIVVWIRIRTFEDWGGADIEDKKLVLNWIRTVTPVIAVLVEFTFGVVDSLKKGLAKKMEEKYHKHYDIYMFFRDDFSDSLVDAINAFGLFWDKKADDEFKQSLKIDKLQSKILINELGGVYALKTKIKKDKSNSYNPIETLEKFNIDNPIDTLEKLRAYLRQLQTYIPSFYVKEMYYECISLFSSFYQQFRDVLLPDVFLELQKRNKYLQNPLLEDPNHTKYINFGRDVFLMETKKDDKTDRDLFLAILYEKAKTQDDDKIQNPGNNTTEMAT
jgi:hypothetical protein